jgi:hypothetical protein
VQYKTLGDTGLLVSTLCFGTMTFHGGTGLFKQLDEVSALPPEYPGWMLPFQSSNRLEPIARTVPRVPDTK